MRVLGRINVSVLMVLFLTSSLCYGQSTVIEIYNRGVEFAAEGKLQKAKEKFDQALKIAPSLESVKSVKISLKVIDDTNDKKIEKKAAIHFFKGIAYMHQGQLAKAIIEHDRAIEVNPRFALAYNERGSCYHVIGQYDKAISDYNKAIKINPRYVDAYYNRARSDAQGKGQFDHAIFDLTMAIKLSPRHVMAYTNRGNCYKEKGQYDKAISDYNKAIKLNPRFAMAYYNRGNAYSSKGNYDQAFSDYNKAIGLNVRHAGAYTGRGFVYMMIKGDKERACSDWRWACKLGDCRNYSIAKQRGHCQ